MLQRRDTPGKFVTFVTLLILAIRTFCRRPGLAGAGRCPTRQLQDGLDARTAPPPAGPVADADIRTVTIPDAIRRDIRPHLDDFVDEDQDALVFTGAKGAVLRRSNFQTACKWRDCVAAAGLPGFHFHDLRHTGNTLASRTGASLADLMARMGHASTRAALIYQHTAKERDEHIASGLSEQIKKGRDRARSGHGQRKKR
ncbi:integrase [Micromonospora sp. M42]|nr:integrase [Micromonospora sp. M42]